MGRKKLDISDEERKLRRLAQLRKAHEKRKHLKRLKERVANLSEMQLEQRRKRELVENLSDIQREQKRQRERVQNLSDMQLEQKRQRQRNIKYSQKLMLDSSSQPGQNVEYFDTAQQNEMSAKPSHVVIKMENKSKECGSSDDEMECGTSGWKNSTKMNFLKDCSLPNVSINTFNNSDKPMSTLAVSSPVVEPDYSIVKEEPCVESSTEQIEDNLKSLASIDDVVGHSCDASHSRSATTSCKNLTPQLKSNQKQYKHSNNVMLSNIMDQTNRLTEEITKQMKMGNQQKSEYYHFGVFLSCCLEKLDGDLNLDAREGINSILEKFEKVQLLRNRKKQ